MDEERPEPSPHHLRSIEPSALVGFACAGLMLGWTLHPVAESTLGWVPRVGWVQGLVLFLAGAVLGYLAWLTWRQLHVRRLRMDPRLAVNRLVLARASSLVGALVAGGYAGFALSWVGSGSELAGERIVRSLVAAAGGVTIIVSALLLERACRTPTDEPPPVT